MHFLFYYFQSFSQTVWAHLGEIQNDIYIKNNLHLSQFFIILMCKLGRSGKSIGFH